MHKSGENHPMSTMKEWQIREMFKLSKDGMMSKDIALKFNISSGQVAHILNGKQWNHLGLYDESLLPVRYRPHLEKIENIINLYADGMNNGDIATKCEVSIAMVRNIVSNRNWKDAPRPEDLQEKHDANKIIVSAKKKCICKFCEKEFEHYPSANAGIYCSKQCHYAGLAVARGDDVLDTKEKKDKLIEMASVGEPRPPREKSHLGMMLSCYVNKAHSCYDIDFDTKIKRLRPDWFQSRKHQKQKLLIEMASSGKSRPSSRKSSVGLALSRYTNKSTNAYDEEFNKKIRELRPDWFRQRHNSWMSF